MDKRTRKNIRTWSVMVLGREEAERFLSVPFADTGFGYDIYGGEREIQLLAYTVGLSLYKYYFNVTSRDIENVPSKGRIILAGNRLGLLPFEVLMAVVDMIINHSPPRLLRRPTEKFVAEFPFTGMLAQRLGQMADNPRNLDIVLRKEEALILQPCESSSIGDLLRRRKPVGTFRNDFIELCLRKQAPIVPVAFFNDSDRLHISDAARSLEESLKLDALPKSMRYSLLGIIRALPLPSRLHISYGEPIAFYEEYPEETIEHPNLIAQMAEVVREKVTELIEEGMLTRRA